MHICCAPMSLVSKMGSRLAVGGRERKGWYRKIYRKSHIKQKIPKFHINRRKSSYLEHSRPCNLSYWFILGWYKHFVWEFWKFSFFADFWGVKVWILAKMFKIGQNSNFEPPQISKKWKYSKSPHKIFVSPWNEPVCPISWSGEL